MARAGVDAGIVVAVSVGFKSVSCIDTLAVQMRSAQTVPVVLPFAADVAGSGKGVE